MDKAKMGTFIKEQRMALGMTQQQLAEDVYKRQGYSCIISCLCAIVNISVKEYMKFQ